MLPASFSDFSSERGWAAPSPCAGSGSELGPICHPHWKAFSSPHGGRTRCRDHCLDLPATHGALGHFREDPPGAVAAEVCVAAGDKAGVGGSVKADDALLSCCGFRLRPLRVLPEGPGNSCGEGTGCGVYRRQGDSGLWKAKPGSPRPPTPEAVPMAFLFWVAVQELPVDVQPHSAANSWGCGSFLLNHLSFRHLLFALLTLPEWKHSASLTVPNPMCVQIPWKAGKTGAWALLHTYGIRCPSSCDKPCCARPWTTSPGMPIFLPMGVPV